MDNIDSLFSRPVESWGDLLYEWGLLLNVACWQYEAESITEVSSGKGGGQTIRTPSTFGGARKGSCFLC